MAATKLTRHAPASGKKALPKPSAKAIAAIERALGHALPDGYKAFLSTYGAGQVGGTFNLRGPGYGEKSRADLGALIAMLRDERELYVELYGDAELIERCVPFVDTIGGDLFVWDPLEPTGKRHVEYAISALVHGADAPRKVAASFSEFLRDVCLGRGYGTLVGDPRARQPPTFMPFSR